MLLLMRGVLESKVWRSDEDCVDSLLLCLLGGFLGCLLAALLSPFCVPSWTESEPIRESGVLIGRAFFGLINWAGRYLELCGVQFHGNFVRSGKGTGRDKK
jgi:hypothetical protein